VEKIIYYRPLVRDEQSRTGLLRSCAADVTLAESKSSVYLLGKLLLVVAAFLRMKPHENRSHQLRRESMPSFSSKLVKIATKPRDLAMLLPEVRLAPRRRRRLNRSYSEISGKVEEEGDGDVVGGCLLRAEESVSSFGWRQRRRRRRRRRRWRRRRWRRRRWWWQRCKWGHEIRVVCGRGAGAVVRQFPGCSGVSEGVVGRHGGRAGRSRGP